MPHHTPIWTPHPSDEALLAAIDKELPQSRALEIDLHLASCEACRRQRDRLESASTDLMAIADASGGETSQRTAQLRARLSTRLATMPEPHATWLPASMTTTAALFAAVIGLAAVLWLRSGLLQRDSASASIEPAARPIHAVTPGAVQPIDVAELCAGRVPVREAVTPEIRQAILHDYQMETVRPDEYELDYLITPELGGSSDRRNLWPERYASRVWNARVKDDLERLLPSLVCQGTLDLATAQQDIATDWIAAYQKYFHTDRPVQTRAGRDADDDRDDHDGELMSLAMPAMSSPWR
jgi:hypothetical protein